MKHQVKTAKSGSNYTTYFRQQVDQGVVLVLLLLTLPVLLCIVAIALNLGYSRMVKTQLKAASDAAAFAGAAALCNEDPNCFLRSRTLAISTLNQHKVYGSITDSKIISIPENDSEHSWTFDNLEISIERGVLKSTGEFESIEPGEPLTDAPQMIPSLVANAVKVVIRRPSILMLLWPSGNRFDISATSIASQGASNTIPIAPFALPLCALINDDSTPMSSSDRCRADRLFTSTSQYGGDQVPEFEYEAGCLSGLCFNSSSYTCHWGNERYTDRTSRHFGVVGLPRANYSGALAPTTSESEVISAISSSSPSDWPAAGIGDAFAILSDGLTSIAGRDAVWKQIFNHNLGPDSEYHPGLLGTTLSTMFTKLRTWPSHCPTELLLPTFPSYQANGLCRSTRFGYADIAGQLCQQTLLPQPVSGWSVITSNTPVWRIKIPVIVDASTTAQPCNANPQIQLSHIHRIVGFVEMNLYDLDIGNLSPSDPLYQPWRPTQCTQADGSIGIPDGPWEFPEACNVVRGKLTCDDRLMIPTTTDIESLYPILRD